MMIDSALDFDFVDPRDLSRPASSSHSTPAEHVESMSSTPFVPTLPGTDLAFFDNHDWTATAWPSGDVDDVPAMDTFFARSGARYAASPCDYCRRNRLQCLVLQTGDANPNPAPACSSCVGLFRECSLAKGKKRDPSEFETHNPVIGQLHGVNEELNLSDLGDQLDDIPPVPSDAAFVPVAATYDRDKRQSSRRTQKTRLLRAWFDTHTERPYPSAEDVDFLSEQSGLSKTQVNNWFTNARRRQRHYARPSASRQFRSGSPMPQMSNQMSPMDRWRHSPPEEDPVSSSAVAAAIQAFPLDSPAADGALDQWPASLPDGWSSSDVSSLYDSLASSVASTSSLVSSTSINRPPSRAGSTRRRRSKANTVIYRCTFCRLPFKKKHDWARHERAVHMPELDTYTCHPPTASDGSVRLQTWLVNSNGPACALCGHTSPENEHYLSHDFQTCSERNASQRTFSRKDHFWQHLHKYHHCKKWEGWDLDLSLWRNQRAQTSHQCAFCPSILPTWSERVAHVSEHFKAGETIV